MPCGEDTPDKVGRYQSQEQHLDSVDLVEVRLRERVLVPEADGVDRGRRGVGVAGIGDPDHGVVHTGAPLRGTVDVTHLDTLNHTSSSSSYSVRNSSAFRACGD